MSISKSPDFPSEIKNKTFQRPFISQTHTDVQEMAASIPTTQSALPAKRKRNQISYAEPEDDFLDSAHDLEEDVAIDGLQDDLSDVDATYGSRKVWFIHHFLPSSPPHLT